MTFCQAVLQGIVEGVTAFWPISSNSHLMLSNYLLGLPETDFQTSFNIALQPRANGEREGRPRRWLAAKRCIKTNRAQRK